MLTNSSESSSQLQSIMSAATQTIKNYRALLKHVKSLPSAQNWRSRVVNQYKDGKDITDPALAEHHRAVADQYVTMISSIKEISHLRGLDFGEKLDPRDKIRATASRVGLAVPRFADDEFAVPLDPTVENKKYVLPTIADETVVKNSS